MYLPAPSIKPMVWTESYFLVIILYACSCVHKFFCIHLIALFATKTLPIQGNTEQTCRRHQMGTVCPILAHCAVNSLTKASDAVALMFSLICARTLSKINKWDAGDLETLSPSLWRHRNGCGKVIMVFGMTDTHDWFLSATKVRTICLYLTRNYEFRNIWICQFI